MKAPKALDEIHAIMEQIYEEEKGLSKEERVKKIRAESEKFMAEYNLKLRRINPKAVNYIAA
ncbi:MAG: hypothetical protein WCQ90_13930, partial [Deltaproteobacteria bacterium]